MVIILRYLILCSLVFASSFSFSDKKANPCWVSFWVKDGYEPITSELAMLKSNTLALDLSDVDKSVENHINIKDFRLLAVDGVDGPVFPGLQDIDKSKICKYGARFIDGAFGSTHGEEYLSFKKKFVIFSSKYNKKMLRYLKENTM